MTFPQGFTTLAPSKPLILHLRGRPVKEAQEAQLVAVREQLDDYITGRDTRPIVLIYDGEVAWVPDPDLV